MPPRVRIRVLSAMAVVATGLVPNLATNGAAAQDAIARPARAVPAAAMAAVPLHSSYETANRVSHATSASASPCPTATTCGCSGIERLHHQLAG